MGHPPQARGQFESAPPRASQGASPASTSHIAELLKPPKDPPCYFVGNDYRAPRTELFDSEARTVAERLERLPPSQLRRFYASVIALRQQHELARQHQGPGQGGLPVELLHSRMGLLKAHAAYTRKRQNDYPDELVSFFTRHAAGVKSWDDFLYGFQPHFEAVIAYHKAFEQKRGAQP